MRTIRDIKYGTEDTNYLDLYLPDGDCADLMIWFHGGSLEFGDRTGIHFHEDLVNRGIGVASVEYRLYPNAKFPEYIEDCANAVAFVFDHMEEYAHPKRVFVCGQSAGAYITLMLAFDEKYLRDAGVDREKIAAFVSDSAQVTTHFNVLRERGEDRRVQRIDEAAPLYHLKEGSRFGNLLLIYYTNDMITRPELNCVFYKSILRLCPDQNAQLEELPGGHCNGSCARNENGTFDFNDAFLNFIEQL